jgi:hypothetical protein
MGGSCSTYGTDEKHNILVEKPGGKRPFVRSRHGWEDNIKMDYREVGWEVVDWIHLSQDRD